MTLHAPARPRRQVSTRPGAPRQAKPNGCRRGQTIPAETSNPSIHRARRLPWCGWARVLVSYRHPHAQAALSPVYTPELDILCGPLKSLNSLKANRRCFPTTKRSKKRQGYPSLRARPIPMNQRLIRIFGRRADAFYIGIKRCESSRMYIPTQNRRLRSESRK